MSQNPNAEKVVFKGGTSLSKAYRLTKRFAEDILKLLGCRYDASQTGLFVWGAIPDNIESCEKWVEEILLKTHVFITPGFIFGKNGERYIRISLCSPENRLTEAKERLRGCLN